METSPAFSEGKSECRVRVFLESGFCTGPSPGPSPVRVSQYAVLLLYSPVGHVILDQSQRRISYVHLCKNTKHYRLHAFGH